MTDNALQSADLDRLGQALLTLTQELWVLKDRQRVLEALLEEAGIIVPDQIDQHEPGAKLSEQLGAERRRLIDRVIGALNATDEAPESS